MIEVENLNKTFTKTLKRKGLKNFLKKEKKKYKAVNNVSFNVKKGEIKYIFPFVNSVDYIYNSSLIYEPSVMKTFAQPLLLQVPKTSKFYAEARRLYAFLNNFLPMETVNIPVDSLIREFIGSGCFNR